MTREIYVNGMVKWKIQNYPNNNNKKQRDLV